MCQTEKEQPMAGCNPDELEYLQRYMSTKQLKRIERRIKKENLIAQRNHDKIIALPTKNVEENTLLPKTEKQKDLINSIYENDQTFVYGCAGTGKTYCSSVIACNMLKRGEIDKIVLTRPNIPTGKSIGFFPGTLEEKMAPWLIPFTSVFKEKLGDTAYEYACKHGEIEIVPFEVIRGRTFKNAFVLLDEAQNTTRDEIKAFVTRIGSNSKMVVNGDNAQSDLTLSNNGLHYILKCIESNMHIMQTTIGVIEFDHEDIVRSDVCADWIRIFDKENEYNLCRT